MKRKPKKKETARIQPKKTRFGQRAILVVAGLLVIAGSAAFYFVRSRKVAPLGSSSVNVVFVSVDTLRADYLRLYDQKGVATPNLENLATTGVLFKNAISQIPYTLPSHTSLFTGLYPISHGVRDNVKDILRKDISTIAEDFRNHGYNTAGFIGSMVLNRTTGLAKGFEYYDDSLSHADVHADDLGAIERRAQDVVNSFEHWYRNRAEQKPFYAFLHFYDPHDPYEPPVPFLPAKDTPQDRYKGEIQYVDHVLGNLFAFLKNQNLWQNTVLVITADHGEMLHEHGEIGHGFFLYQPALSVPLILHVPQITEAKVFDEIVELVDVPSTILDLANLPIPKQMQGESLAPLIRDKSRKKNRFAIAETYFASVQLGVSPAFSIQDANWKYIDSPRPELYDLLNDPSESKNVVEQKKSLSQQMKKKLAQLGALHRVPQKGNEQREITAEQAEQFAALGYLGGGFSEEHWDLRKDPKDYIDEWKRILNATTLTQQHKFAEALTMIDQIIRESGHPTEHLLILKSKCYSGLGQFSEAENVLKQIEDSSISSTFLAGIYSQTGREKEASAAYQHALQQRFSYFVLYNYVFFLKRANRKQEALDLIKKVQESRGDAEQARPLLAEIYFVLEDWDKAKELLVELARDRPWEAKWYIQLASLYQIQNQPKEGLVLMLKQYEQFSNNSEYLLRLGILFRAVGDGQREMATFQKMIQVARRDPRGYFYLAKAVLDHQKNATAAIQLSRQGFSLQPDPSMQILGHYILSDAYHAVGNPSESQKEFQMAQKLEKK